MRRVKAVKLTPEVIEARLRAYERRYGMDSAEFQRRWDRGEFDHGPHDDDFFAWATLIAFTSERVESQA
ncbi:MAG: hypothetical protein WEB00_05005 [Dehalococcoidia bacterium]